MSNHDAEQKAPGGFERHAQTLIGAVLLAILLWAGATLLDVRVQLSRIEGRLLATDARERTVDNELAIIRSRLRDIEIENARGAGGRAK